MTRRRQVIAPAAAAIAALAGPLRAEPARHLRVSVDGVVPFAAWDQVAGPGLGGSLTVAVAIAPTIDVTGRVGAIGHLPVDGAVATTQIVEAPILGGARYRAAELGTATGFVFGEVGMVAVRTTVSIGSVRDHDSAVRFASAVGGGVGFGRVDVRIAAWLADLGDLDHGVGATLSIGCDVVRW